MYMYRSSWLMCNINVTILLYMCRSSWCKPGQIQLQGGQTLQLQGQQGQPQQIIIQQPQTAITAGQNQVALHPSFAQVVLLLGDSEPGRSCCRC